MYFALGLSRQKDEYGMIVVGGIEIEREFERVLMDFRCVQFSAGGGWIRHLDKLFQDDNNLRNFHDRMF